MYVCFPFYLGDFQHFMGSSDFQSGGTLKSCPFTAAKWQATSPGLSKKDGSPIRFRCFCSNRKQVLYFCKGNNARMKPSYVNSKWCLWWFIGTPYYPFGTLFEGPGIGHDVSSLTRKTSIYMLGIQSASFVPSISKYQQILCIYDHCSNLFYLTRKTTEKQSETEKKNTTHPTCFHFTSQYCSPSSFDKKECFEIDTKMSNILRTSCSTWVFFHNLPFTGCPMFVSTQFSGKNQCLPWIYQRDKGHQAMAMAIDVHARKMVRLSPYRYNHPEGGQVQR